MVSDGRQEDKDYVQEEEPTSVDEPRYTIKKLGFVGGMNESTTRTHNQALQTAKDDFLVPGTSLLEFSNGHPLLKAEAVRKICCLDSERKEEEKIKKRHDEVVQAKAAKMDRLDQILLDGSLVRLELWLIFSYDIGLPHIFNSVPCRYRFTFSSPQVLSLECSVDLILHHMKNVQVQIVHMPTTQYMKRCSLQLPADIIAVLPRHPVIEREFYDCPVSPGENVYDCPVTLPDRLFGQRGRSECQRIVNYGRLREWPRPEFSSLQASPDPLLLACTHVHLLHSSSRKKAKDGKL
ncbi:hypothetical protein NC652_025900 [Populus alba x Populus x berolinensis]|nr:hypothetical protein NC652_025900 [Populus alba x Populus x berolinensis]